MSNNLIACERAFDKPTFINCIERPPLEQRLSTPAPENFAQLSLKNLHFSKTKYLNRLKEVCLVFDAVKTCLEPIQLNLNEEDKGTRVCPLGLNLIFGQT